MISALEIARRLEEALSDFEKTHSQKEAVELARKILQTQDRLFGLLSLLRGKRDGLVEYMDNILHALDEDGSDALDQDFVPKKKKSSPKSKHKREVGPKKSQRIAQTLRNVIKKLKEANVLRKDGVMQLGLELADAGKSICCEEPFEDLRGYIQHQLMDGEEEPPTGPCATLVPVE